MRAIGMAMPARQTMPKHWLIIPSCGPEILRAARRLPRGSGLLVVGRDCKPCERGLRNLARARHLILIREHPRAALRVHDLQEVRSARLQKTPILFLSPLHPTRSHPDWKPIGRMRAAALARLGGRKIVALGGMNEKRFRSLAPLGFGGWAGISSWIG